MAEKSGRRGYAGWPSFGSRIHGKEINLEFDAEFYVDALGHQIRVYLVVSIYVQLENYTRPELNSDHNRR
jgi:hypothetical protein